ncbi:MAG: hypothetical protein NTU53_00420, partial [Planctomycetota bacterium]|nr:hypothetical protein [Planctomycetota bacterium]
MTHERGKTLFERICAVESNAQHDYVIEKQDDGVNVNPFSTAKIDWSYDALNRLTAETRDEGDDGIVNGQDYTATCSFDLVGNRTRKQQAGYQAATTDYTYNNRDELLTETTGGVVIGYGYDANGSLTSNGSSTYAWDLRNRMVSATAGGVTTSYGYDQDGQRISQRTGTGPSTYYLNDSQNPMGYAQILEERSGSTPPGATLVRSYFSGLRVEGQADASGSVWFVRDG